MKHTFIIIISILFSLTTSAQQQVVIPIETSKAGQFLDLKIINGTIDIMGTDRKDILLRYLVKDQRDEHKDDHRPAKARGMKKIGGPGYSLDIQENGSTVSITSESVHTMLDIKLEVPKGINLMISKSMGERIRVDQVSGTIDLDASIGDVLLRNVSGVVNANAATGNIQVMFQNLAGQKAMTFHTITGDIDLTFPVDYKANLKMKTEMGDIYSDLVIDLSDAPAEVEEGEEFKKITAGWVKGTINGGGAQITTKTKVGGIYIRGKK